MFEIEEMNGYWIVIYDGNYCDARIARQLEISYEKYKEILNEYKAFQVRDDWYFRTREEAEICSEYLTARFIVMGKLSKK